MLSQVVRSGTLLTLLALCAACSPPPTLVEIPVLEGTQTVLVATESLVPQGPSRVLRVVAIDPRKTSGVEQDLLVAAQGSDAERMRLTALLYVASLEDLGLQARTLPEARLAGLGRPLPSPDAIYVLVVGQDEANAWTASESVSPELLAFRFVDG